VCKRCIDLTCANAAQPQSSVIDICPLYLLLTANCCVSPCTVPDEGQGAISDNEIKKLH
jgi:hypothetical protein